MRKIWRFIRRSRRRTIVATSIAVLATAGTALAFYLVLGQGSGSGTQALGTASTKPVNVNVTFAPGLVPGGSEPVTVTADNPGIAQVELTKATFGSITTSVPGCDPTWFTVTPSASTPTLPVTLPAQSSGTPVLSGTVTFTDNGADQTICSGGSITIPANVN